MAVQKVNDKINFDVLKDRKAKQDAGPDSGRGFRAIGFVRARA